jgi:Flp pilus assembly pilin Flp
MSRVTTKRRMFVTSPMDRGAVAAEYVLLAALIAVVIILAVVFLGDSLVGLFNETASSYDSVS